MMMRLYEVVDREVVLAVEQRQSGKRRFSGTAVIRLGNARLRKALWMAFLTGAIQSMVASVL
jgi:hypothetical protein